MEVTDLTCVQRDVLKEIGNIGAGNAATSMSKLIDKKVNMQIPSVNMVSFDEMMNMAGGAENIVAAVYFRIDGDLDGTIHFVFTVQEAEHLISQVTGIAYNLSDGESADEIAVSALQETGNILAGAYLTALADFTALNIKASIPVLNIDMAGAILTASLDERSLASDYVIVIDTRINDGCNGMNGHLFLMPEPESLSTLFSALGADNDKTT
jgi:chemotaxis protein CheC